MSRIEVVPYNLQWPDIFDQEAALIKQAFGPNCSHIHHVGSTAIPGMPAKPIIDIIPVVQDIIQVDAAANAMADLGYEVKGEAGMLFRRFFLKRGSAFFNVHVYEADAGEVDRLIKFRDWMRTHQQDADDYANLKVKLTSLYPEDILQYVMGKENLVARIDRKTGFNGIRIVKALTDREWQAYHRIRKEQIFDLIGAEYNPQHPSLNDPAHIHLVLYKGSDIAGVAHLQFLDDHNAVLRPFAMDAPYQKKGLGSIYLKQIERWLRQQGCQLLRLHAQPKAVKFYERLGYERMPFVEESRPVVEGQVDMGKIFK